MVKLLNDRLPEKWEARWIDPELSHGVDERQPSSVLRRDFNLDCIGHAVLYMTCHGLYVAELNGTRVGDFILAPGTGAYGDRLCVQAYDVTELLHKGLNGIKVTLGDGWYRGSVGIDGIRNYYGSDLALLCQLEIDGKVVLSSDADWEASQNGPVRENDLQQGESYDAGLEHVTGWHGVALRDFGFENLCGEPFVPILEHERFKGRLIITPNGEKVIDYGQNLSGYTEIRVRANAGQMIEIWHGETLDEDGNFTQENFNPGDRSKNGGIPQKLTYICKDGDNIWKPRFTIFGFRYAKIKTDIDLNDAEFNAIAVYSEMEQTGFFECGDADVNKLFRNSIWSMKSNFCDIPTDCPTRERAGWTGDAGVFAPTGLMLMDCAPVLRKWLGECRIAQHEDGLVENIAPVNNSGSMISNLLQGSSGWGDACILVPWAIYQSTGDVRILEENYNMMCCWLSFVEKRAGSTRDQNMGNPYRDYLVDQGFHFGEWCQPDVDNTEAMKKTMMMGAPEVATAYYHRSAYLLSEIAGILGHEEDSTRYRVIADGARKAYRHCCTDNGAIVSDRQCDYVRPIAFGLLDGPEIRIAADALNDLVVRNNYHLNTGFLSTPDLCRVLAENGHVDTAYRLLLQKDCPGWLYAVSQGATTIWETWDGHESLNHYSYGAVSGWLLSGVCGIRISSEGLAIHPYPHRSIGFAKGELHSRFGIVRSEWVYRNDRLVLSFDVPVQAVIELPDATIDNVEAGEHEYEILL